MPGSVCCTAAPYNVFKQPRPLFEDPSTEWDLEMKIVKKKKKRMRVNILVCLLNSEGLFVISHAKLQER